METFDFEFNGRQFRATVHADPDHGRPWEEQAGHGEVREGSRNYDGPEKRAGELVLHDGGRREYLWLYDYPGACETARRDGWGVDGGRLPGETARQYAARAAMADFEHLRGYCSGAWEWVGVGVQLLDADGETIGGEYDFSLWGIESNADEYLQEVARDLAGEILAQRAKAWREHLKEARARKYWESRDVQTTGV